ncbi:hypothetical protein NIES4073_12850 [Kalymmatonema gypsitolerans NIES-4073]|nr:hypothetical protein NIES4073_12850 [Scytonema sp. NIES-4073]
MMLINLEAEKGTFLENLQIVRGPYLQVGTESSIIIRWATDAPIHGKVWYGTNPDKLDLTQEETTITCDHTVKLTGLMPDTKYYYAIGTTTGVQVGGTEDYFFVTAPSQDLAPEQVRPLRILVLGDAGRGNDIAASVRDGYLKFTQTRHTDLWLMLGDNAYDTGTYEEYQRGIFEMYPQFLRSSVLWTAIGNHDGGSADSVLQTGPYYELFTMPSRGEAGGVPSGTAAYYSFDYGNIHFICLDSYGSDRARPPQAGDGAERPLRDGAERPLRDGAERPLRDGAGARFAMAQSARFAMAQSARFAMAQSARFAMAQSARFAMAQSARFAMAQSARFAMAQSARFAMAQSARFAIALRTIP